MNYKNYIRNLLLLQKERFLPQWLVLIKDLTIIVFSFTFAYTLRYNFQLTDEIRATMFHQIVFVVLTALPAFYITGLYKSIIRYTGARDAIQVVKAISCVVGLLLIINILDNFYHHYLLTHVPYAIIIIFFLVSIVLFIFTRFSIRLVYYWLKSHGYANNVLIYGAGQAGIITKNVLINDHDNRIRVVGFVDNHSGKVGKSIEGVPVFSTGILNKKFLDHNNIHEIIFAIQNIELERKREIIEGLLLQTHLEVKEIPPVSTWINGKLSAKQISRVKITDLLQRSEIRLDSQHLFEHLEDKRVMVTGAAGSIGSEIVRQLCQLRVGTLIMIDQAETPMYELENELRERFPHMADRCVFFLTNVGDKNLLPGIFETYHPEIIYHAAAYKHVPLMELNPFEAVRVNIFGTKNVADLASKFGVERFVMISTDKAVNPTNVMGATKRAAEIYIQSLNHEKTNYTKFITTRFGNVLGSNGSVIPLFEKQIAAGGPVTVTHPEITRYFMTIPEACQLVLEAGTMGNGGEIFMFDMGKPVRISDLAYNMIRLSGLEPDKDIKIAYTGLRPGEKLYEELLYDKELCQATHHPKISIAKVRYNRYISVLEYLSKLGDATQTGNKMQLVAALKVMVPEFKSNNSIYQKLDVKSEPAAAVLNTAAYTLNNAVNSES